MIMITKIYWKIRYAFERRYFKVRYGGRAPGIYYDRIFKVYVNPEMIEERGPLFYVLCETVRDGLIYPYYIGTLRTHAHSFDVVMRDAYENGAAFSIPEEFRSEYSEQELSLLQKLAAQNTRHKKKDFKNEKPSNNS